jgi:hypothetical protein
MKRFLLKTILLTFILIAIYGISLLWIAIPTASDSLLAALPEKHELLANAQSPKIVFAGGSNLSFGLDSRRISEEFKMPVVNMGMHGGIGLRYMMNDVLPYIKQNDIVVLVPEYDLFYEPGGFYGQSQLVMLVFDIFPQGRQFISIEHWQHLAPYVLKYAKNKFNNLPWRLSEKALHSSKTIKKDNPYGRYSFNNFGDAYLHWDKANKIVLPADSSANETVDPSVLSGIREFKNSLQTKGADLILLPSVYQESSFRNNQCIINAIDTQLSQNGLAYLVAPSRYMFSDNLFYDTYYHLNKQGVDLRTTFMIDDLRILIHK